MARATSTTTKGRRLSARAVGLKHGFRSGLEEKVAAFLEENGIPNSFERFVVPYLVPERKAKYTPDFTLLDNGVIIETKGQFKADDRKKHLLVKEAHPDLDIRFVFSNPNARISKTSQTTYAMWCEKHGYQYAKALPPVEWLSEPPEEKRLAAVAQLIDKNAK